MLFGLGLGALAACRSWGGWIAVALTGGFVAAVQYGPHCAAWYRTRSSRFFRTLLPISLLAIAGLGIAGALVWAPRANIESFNGRLYHLRIALAEFARNPILGVGPGQHYSQGRYAGEIGWQMHNQAILEKSNRRDLFRHQIRKSIGRNPPDLKILRRQLSQSIYVSQSLPSSE